MKPKSDSIELYLKELEMIGNDELRLFTELEPTYYTIRHLLEIREQWIEQLHLFHRINNIKNLLGFSTVAWGLITAFCFYMNTEDYFLIICLFICSIFTSVFIFSLLIIYSRFKSKARLDNIGKLINEELEKRGVKIPHYDYQKNGH